MAKAAEMVDLAERFRATMAAQRKAAQQGGEGAEQPDAEAQQWMDSEMQAELVHMGIASPVTKAESGARYHQELSRQVTASLAAGRICRSWQPSHSPDGFHLAPSLSCSTQLWHRSCQSDHWG